MPHPFKRDRFTWLAYWMLAFYAYFLNVLGPITPFLKDELKLSYTVSSLHFTAFAVGILLVGVGGHLLIRRLGQWRSLWLGAVGMSASVLLLLVGRTPAVTVGGSFLMGLVGSLILAIVPSTLSERHGEDRSIALEEANVVASLVASAAPLMVGWFAASAGGWRLGLAIAACTPMLLGFGFRRAGPPVDEGSAPGLNPGSSTLPTLYWVYWSAIVLAVSVEFCMIFWSADYLENGLGMPKIAAAQAVSLFLGAMIVGRLAGSRLVGRFSPHRLVEASTLLAAVGFLIFLMASTAWLGEAGLFLTGLGTANLYPLILSLALGASGERSIQASARATLASGSAILVLPLMLGRLADLLGIRPAYGLVLVLLAGIYVILLVTSRLSESRRALVG